MEKVNVRNTIQPVTFPGGFTVLMAVYRGDDPKRFELALNSVFANTLQPDRMILVVDGAVPLELEISISALQALHSCVRVFRLPVNEGLARALNAGLKLVVTEWVVRADADDYNLPVRFALQAAAIRNSNNQFDLVGGAIQEIDSNGNILGIRRTVELHNDIRRFAAFRCPFNHMTVAYRTSFALRCGGYPHIHLKEDYALWALMLASGAQMYNLPDILVFATAGKDMYRRRGGWRYAIAEIALQKHLVTTGLKSFPVALFHGVARSIVFLFPTVIRGLIYKLSLRE